MPSSSPAAQATAKERIKRERYTVNTRVTDGELGDVDGVINVLDDYTKKLLATQGPCSVYYHLDSDYTPNTFSTSTHFGKLEMLASRLDEYRANPARAYKKALAQNPIRRALGAPRPGWVPPSEPKADEPERAGEDSNEGIVKGYANDVSAAADSD